MTRIMIAAEHLSVMGWIVPSFRVKERIPMIVQRDPNEKKPVEKTEEESKEDLLGELRKESLATISLACVYAKKLEETGMDITERWATAEQQSEIIQNFYYQGYEKGFNDGIARGKEIERQEMILAQSGEYGVDSDFFDPSKLTVSDLKAVANRKRRRSATKKKRRYK